MPDAPHQPGLGPLLELTQEAVALLEAGDARRPAARIVEVNAAFLELTRASAADVMRRGLALLRAPGTDREAFARLVSAVEARTAIDLTLLAARADGTTFPAELRGRPLEDEPRRYALMIHDASERRRAEEAVQELAEHLQALSELTSDYVYALNVAPDCRLNLEWVAGAFTRITGYDLEEIEARGGWVELVEPEDLPALQRRNQRLLAGEPAVAEYRIVTKSGERRWLCDSGRPQLDADGRLVLRLLCTAVDMTERRLDARRLELSEHDRQRLARLVGGVACRLDGDGRLLEVLGQGAGDLATRLKSGLGRPLGELLGPELAWAWRQQLDRVLPGGEPVHVRFSHEAGGVEETFEAEISAVVDDMFLVVILPLAPVAPPLAEGMAERPAELRLASVFDAVDTLVVRLSPELEIHDLNAAAERITGWRRADLVGRRFVELFVRSSERQAVLKDLETTRRGGRVEERQGTIKLRDGTRRPLLWSFAPLTERQGRVTEVVVSGQGIVSTAEAEQALRAGQQRLSAIMDHVADGIITMDAEGVIESFSRSAEGIFDYRRDEVLGRRIDVLLTAGAANDVVGKLKAASRQPRELEEMLGRRRTGEAIPIELAVNEVDVDDQSLFILTVRDITLRKQTEETIRNLAYHDPLTGLPNRLLFHDRLSQAVERAKRNRQMLAVMLLDLDRFKVINDSLGLEKGDQVLRAVAERLTATVRRSDTVARLGGDEFLLLLPGTEGAEVAAKVAQKLLDCLKPLLAINSHELNVSASVGIALYPHDGETAETLIKNADTALYRAKEQGRNVYQFYTNDMNAAAFERLVLETQLRKALERGELVLYYQPLLSLESGAVVGAEALVRWFHPDLGMIPPGDFIPLAEETGLILPIGEWVLRTACTQVQRWHRLGFEELRLAVNLSARQFQQADLVPLISRLLQETGFAAEHLELELTESIIMRHAAETVDKLRAIDGLGIRLAVDDFGTGYSSLSYLKRFPIRSLKIDRSFIQDITSDPNDAAIAQAIVALAESLNLKVIAEGVETREQLELLRRYRCDEMQGFLFSRPLPADELLALLREGRRLPR